MTFRFLQDSAFVSYCCELLNLYVCIMEALVQFYSIFLLLLSKILVIMSFNQLCQVTDYIQAEKNTEKC